MPLESDEGALQTSFDFGNSKGFLGPTSNTTAGDGIFNADQTIFAVNHQPVTKSSYVHFILRSDEGDVLFVNNVNDRVAKLLPPRWSKPAEFFLRVESISERIIKFSTTDFRGKERESYSFSATISDVGAISLTK